TAESAVIFGGNYSVQVKLFTWIEGECACAQRFIEILFKVTHKIFPRYFLNHLGSHNKRKVAIHITLLGVQGGLHDGFIDLLRIVSVYVQTVGYFYGKPS